jgi:uncharacterized membrane protein (UPF0127 family)
MKPTRLTSPLALVSVATFACVFAASSMLFAFDPPATTPPATPPTTKPPTPPASTPNEGPSKPTDGKPTPPAAKPTKQKPATVPTKDDILEAKPFSDLPKERIVLLGEQFDAEFCFDEVTRATGMGARDKFPEGTAMIFVHPRAIMLNYWMKDCLIDMDMIFVDGKGRVTAVHEATREKLRSTGETKERYESRLYRYSSRMPAQFVIELPPGSIKRLKPMVSQQLNLDWARYAQRAK